MLRALSISFASPNPIISAARSSFAVAASSLEQRVGEILRLQKEGITMSSFVIHDKQGDVAVLAMADEWLDAFGMAARESRAIVFTGEGRGFCSGSNLFGLDPRAPDYDAGAPLVSHFNPLMSMLRNLPIPLVTAVNGVAAGIGCALALAGDMIVASERAYFLQAFRRVALVPDGASAFLLTRAIGRVRAM